MIPRVSRDHATVRLCDSWCKGVLKHTLSHESYPMKRSRHTGDAAAPRGESDLRGQAPSLRVGRRRGGWRDLPLMPLGSSIWDNALSIPGSSLLRQGPDEEGAIVVVLGLLALRAALLAALLAAALVRDGHSRPPFMNGREVFGYSQWAGCEVSRRWLRRGTRSCR